MMNENMDIDDVEIALQSVQLTFTKLIEQGHEYCLILSNHRQSWYMGSSNGLMYVQSNTHLVHDFFNHCYGPKSAAVKGSEDQTQGMVSLNRQSSIHDQAQDEIRNDHLKQTIQSNDRTHNQNISHEVNLENNDDGGNEEVENDDDYRDTENDGGADNLEKEKNNESDIERDDIKCMDTDGSVLDESNSKQKNFKTSEIDITEKCKKPAITSNTEKSENINRNSSSICSDIDREDKTESGKRKVPDNIFEHLELKPTKSIQRDIKSFPTTKKIENNSLTAKVSKNPSTADNSTKISKKSTKKDGAIFTMVTRKRKDSNKGKQEYVKNSKKGKQTFLTGEEIDNEISGSDEFIDDSGDETYTQGKSKVLEKRSKCFEKPQKRKLSSRLKEKLKIRSPKQSIDKEKTKDKTKMRNKNAKTVEEKYSQLIKVKTESGFEVQNGAKERKQSGMEVTESCDDDSPEVDNNHSDNKNVIAKDGLYRCKICVKTFRIKSDIRHHLLLHTCLRNFVCSFCQAEFVFCSGLRSHVPTCKQNPNKLNFGSKKDGNYVNPVEQKRRKRSEGASIIIGPSKAEKDVFTNISLAELSQLEPNLTKQKTLLNSFKKLLKEKVYDNFAAHLDLVEYLQCSDEHLCCSAEIDESSKVINKVFDIKIIDDKEHYFCQLCDKELMPPEISMEMTPTRIRDPGRIFICSFCNMDYVSLNYFREHVVTCTRNKNSVFCDKDTNLGQMKRKKRQAAADVIVKPSEKEEGFFTNISRKELEDLEPDQQKREGLLLQYKQDLEEKMNSKLQETIQDVCNKEETSGREISDCTAAEGVCPVAVEGEIAESEHVGSEEKQVLLTVKIEPPPFEVDLQGANLNETSKALLLAMENPEDNDMFFCKLCGKLMKNKCMAKHHLMAHASLENFICKFCNSTFVFIDGLKEHVVSCTKNPDRLVFAKDVEHTHKKRVRRMKGASLVMVPVDTEEIIFTNMTKEEFEQQEPEEARRRELTAQYREIMRRKEESNMIANISDIVHAKNARGMDVVVQELMTNDSSITKDTYQWFKTLQQDIENNKDTLCKICHIDLLTVKALCQHLDIHKGIKSLKCSFCGERFFYIHFLKHHIVSCKKNPEKLSVVTKKECNFAVNNLQIDDSCLEKTPYSVGKFEKDLTKADEEVVKDLECNECEEKFCCLHDLWAHQSQHLKKCIVDIKTKKPGNASSVTCSTCNKIFKTSQNLKRHIQAVHIAERNLKCEICGQLFKSDDTYRRHKKTVHNEYTGTHQCEVCGKAYQRLGLLKTHMLSHTVDKSFMCDQCGKTFKQKILMKKHKMQIHSDLRQFDCKICGKAYKLKSKLQFHMKRHVINNETDENFGKIFECEICSKKFVDGSNRRLHMAIHFRGSVQCNRCGKWYKTEKSLASHHCRQQNVNSQSKMTKLEESDMDDFQTADESIDGPSVVTTDEIFPQTLILQNSVVQQSDQSDGTVLVVNSDSYNADNNQFVNLLNTTTSETGEQILRIMVVPASNQ